MLKRIEYPATGDILYTGTAANGLRIRVLPRKGFSGFYAVFAASYGGVHRRFRLNGVNCDTPAGVAHFLEHKMFDLPDGDNALKLLSQNGADPNAFTSSDVTCYYFHCTRDFDDNLRMLLHFVSTPFFTEETVAKEQGIIGQEIRMGEDNPGVANYYSLLNLLYAVHPIREKTIGTAESISQITADILCSCHRAFYSPSNMVLCVAGNLDPEQILTIAEEMISAGEPEELVKDVPLEATSLPSKWYAEIEMPVATPQFLIGAKIDVLPKGPVYLRQQLIADLSLRLLAGPSSSFYNRLYAEGLLSRAFDADADFTDGAGHAVIGGESRDPQAVLEALKAELKRIETEGLNRKLFRRAQKAAIGGILRSMEDFDDVCISLALGEFDGFCYLDYPAVLESITIGECEAFLKETLSPERLAMSVVHSGRG